MSTYISSLKKWIPTQDVYNTTMMQKAKIVENLPADLFSGVKNFVKNIDSNINPNLKLAGCNGVGGCRDDFGIQPTNVFVSQPTFVSAPPIIVAAPPLLATPFLAGPVGCGGVGVVGGGLGFGYPGIW